MNLYLPHMYQKDIFSVNYEKLKKNNIKCLLFDLDNTIASKHMKKPIDKVVALVSKLKEMGFTIYLFSNASKSRLAPFEKELNVKAFHRVFKPLQKNYRKILNNLPFKKEEIACFGDQLLTDIKGGNKFGIKTVFLDPLYEKDDFITIFNRHKEKRIIKKLEKENKFKKGYYYDIRE